MSANVPTHWNEDFDEPWRRLPWIILAAVLSWVLLLGGFAKLLKRTPVPEPPPTTIEARIIELPPPVAGLQGGGGPAGGAPAHAIAHPAPVIRPLPKPAPVAKPKPVHHVHKIKPKPIVTEPPSPFGTARHVEEPAPPIASKGPAGGATERRGGAANAEGGGEGGIGGGTGSGNGAGIGSDSSGARAMYAPTPTIPDDLREGAFSTMAIAQFKVSPDGDVEVTLVKPTPNPRLNQILLDTLKQWKFFPAMKDGVAIASQFEVRIPIAVQ
jgi:protein TonB